MIHKIKKYATTNTLVLFGILSGFFRGTFGLLFPELALQQKIIGSAFIAFLKMLAVPLFFASIYVAILVLGSLEHLKNIGLRTIFFYFLTTALAVFLAIIAMNIFAILFGVSFGSASGGSVRASRHGTIRPAAALSMPAVWHF